MNKNKPIKSAMDEVKRAEEALLQSQKNLVLAQVRSKASKTMGALRQTSNMLWEMCRLTNWEDEEVKALYKKSQAFEDEMALLMFGAGERCKKLNALDPERWPLDNEYAISPRNYLSDEDMAHAIATAIFDHGFGRGSERAYEDLPEGQQKAFREFRQAAREACGQELADLGFTFWEQGRHDT